MPGLLLKATAPPDQLPVPRPTGTSAATSIVRCVSVKSEASQEPAAAPRALMTLAIETRMVATWTALAVAVVERAAERLGGSAGVDGPEVRRLVDGQGLGQVGVAGRGAAGLPVGGRDVGVGRADQQPDEERGAADRLGE